MTGGLLRTADTSSIDATLMSCDTTFGPDRDKSKLYLQIMYKIFYILIQLMLGNADVFDTERGDDVTCPENVDPSVEFLPDRVQIRRQRDAGRAERSAVICSANTEC